MPSRGGRRPAAAAAAKSRATSRRERRLASELIPRRVVSTGGLAAGEDLDEVAEGDYWRQNFRRRPYFQPGTPYEHYETGYRYGWQSALADEHAERDFEEVESELERSWDALHGENAQDWGQARHAARDAWERARDRHK